MNWDAIGAVAEVLGGVATVATLAYLALQIRQSSAATRAQIRQSIADSQIHYLNSRSTDPFLRRATQDAFAGHEMDDGDTVALRVHLVAHLRLFESHHSQFRLGALDEEDWRAQRTLLRGLLRIDAYRQAYAFIRTTYGEAWNREFAAEVERCLSEPKSPAA